MTSSQHEARFFGRATLVEALCASTSWLNVVAGAAGMGKSALRAEVVRRLLLSGRITSLVVLEVQEWRDSPDQALIAGVSRALGLGWRGEPSALARYFERAPATLIVIEDAEWCDEDALWGALAQLRALAPMASVLLLTRSCDAPWSARAIEGLLTLHILSPLGSSQAPEAALSLFEAQLGRAVAAHERAQVVGMLEVLGFHPLSIELSAAMARFAGLDYVQAQLTTLNEAPDAQRLWSVAQLERLFHHSWRALDASTRAFLEGLAVVPLPIALTQVAALFSARFELVRVLADASRHALIEIDAKAQLLTMPQAFRVFCAAQATAHEAQHQQEIKRLLIAALARHEQASVRWALLDDAAAIEALIADAPLLTRLMRAAWGWLDASLMASLGRALFVAYAAQESSLMIEPELWEIVRHGEGEAGLELILLEADLVLEELGRTYDEESLRRLAGLDARLRSVDSLESRRMQWWIATQMTWARILRGEFELARAHIEELQRREASFEALGRPLEAVVTASLKMREASLIHQEHHVEAAISSYERALYAARRAGDHRSQSMVMHNLGVLYTDLLRLDEAERCLRPLVESTLPLGRTIHALNHLAHGMISLRRGALEAAERAFLSAAELMRLGQLHNSLGLIDLNLAAVALDRGETDAASAHVLQALHRAHGQRDDMLHAHALLLRVNCWAFADEVEQLWRGVQELLALPVLELDAGVALKVCALGMAALAVLSLRAGLNEAEDFVRQARDLLPQERAASEPMLAAILAQVEGFVALYRALAPSAGRAQRALLIAWLSYEQRWRALHPVTAEGNRFLSRLMARRVPERYLSHWLAIDARRLGADRWLIDRAGELHCDDQGRWIDLSRHEQLAQLVCLLGQVSELSLEPLSLDELERRLWPDEVIHPEAANNRLHVALSKLRAKGFGALIERHGDGYRLATSARIVWVGERSSS